MSARAAPFVHSGATTSAVMVQVWVALVPVCAVAAWRPGGAPVLVAGIGAAWATDWLCDRRAALDGSAVITGALVALMLPAAAPWWLAAIGGAVGVGVGKHVFGGLGRNPFNPAALARAVLMGLAPGLLFASGVSVDGLTMATPLSADAGLLAPTWADVVWGRRPGSLAGAAPVAVVAGGLWLVAIEAVDWRVPLTFLAAVAFFALVLPPSERIVAHAPWLAGNPLLHLLAGGAPLAAFFLLSDPVTSPWAANGRAVFAIIAALFTVVVRFYTPYPDGAALGVLVANAATPLIDRYFVDRAIDAARGVGASPARAPGGRG